jgi:hypothetical protein
MPLTSTHNRSPTPEQKHAGLFTIAPHILSFPDNDNMSLAAPCFHLDLLLVGHARRQSQWDSAVSGLTEMGEPHCFTIHPWMCWVGHVEVRGLSLGVESWNA